MNDMEVLMRGSRKLVAVAAVVVAAGALVVPASGKRGLPAEDVTIKLKFTPRGIPVFKGPDEVLAGGSITVINKTDPNATGPQSFSLVSKDELPRTEAQRTKCGKSSNRRLICKDIAEAHDIVNRSANIPDVDNGVDGTWDAVFDGESPGDSFYFEQFNGESHTRAVTEDPGRLHFLSIIYVKAQGSIKVVAP